jgi:hypothetical protein
MNNLPDLGISPTPEKVEEFFVVWSGFIFTDHGVNVVVICLSAFALDSLF